MANSSPGSSVRFPSARSGAYQFSEKNQVPSFDKFDPLLSNLSPESTLEALSSTNAVPKTEKVAHDNFSESISRVSPAERALCIRAAVAAKKLRSWYREVQSWPWPRGTDMHLGKGFIPPPAVDVGEKTPETTYYGSLPESVIEQCDGRIEEIRDEIDELSMEDLKEHVLDVHIPYRSRPSSASTASVPPPLSQVQLSDFTTVITATILRALPYLSRLTSLLSTWDVRLLVLRQIPGLLNGLQLTRRSLDSSIESLRSTTPPKETDELYSKANYRNKQVELDSMVVAAGKMMDAVLDALEGREDSLPEKWIDDLEAIEADFSNWVVEAEKRAFANECIRLTAMTKKETPQVHSDEPEEPRQLTTPVDKPDTAHQDGRPPVEAATEKEQQPSNCPAPKSWDVPNKPSVVAEQDSASRTPESSPNVALDDPSVEFAQASSPSNAAEPRTNGTPSKQQPSSADPENTGYPAPLEIPTPSSPSTPYAAKPEFDPEADAVQQKHESIETEDTKWNADSIVAGSIPDVAVPLPKFERVNGGEAAVETSESSDGDITKSVPSDLHDSKEAVRRTQSEQPAIVLNESNVQHEDEPVSQTRDENPDRREGPAHKTDVAVSVTSDSKQGVIASVPPVDTLTGIPKDAVEQNTKQTELRSDSAAPSEIPRTSTLGASSTERVTAEPLTTDDSISPNGSPFALSRGLSRPSKPANLLDHDKGAVVQGSSESTAISQGDADIDSSAPSQNRLDSPIKLTDPRTSHACVKEEAAKPQRRASGASDDVFSGFPSSIPSPGFRGRAAVSSSRTTMPLETPPRHKNEPPLRHRTPSSNNRSLREHHLLSLEDQETLPNMTQGHNHDVSLPLLRFINERLDFHHDEVSDLNADGSAAARRASGSSDYQQSHNQELIHHTDLARFSHNRRAATLRSRFSLDEITTSFSGSEAGNEEHERDSHPGSPNYRPQLTNLASYLNNPLINKRLKPHPSLESLGLWKADPERQRRDSIDTDAQKSEPQPPPRPPPVPKVSYRKPKDQMDERVSSLLSTIPGRIRLASRSGRDFSESPIISSLAQKERERQLSESPEGTPSRSSTPAPSLFLTPAEPRGRRQSSSQAPEDRSVRVYHLGDKRSKPSKLFVRSVGGNSERLMVRVGGGWADLGEYLREYAIHHGHRQAAEVPRIEAEGPSPSASPGSRTSGGILTRPLGVPSRPSSVLSSRPSSPLVVRRTRRASNASDASDLRATTGGKQTTPSSPTSSARRRLSLSSNHSNSQASRASSPNNSPQSSFITSKLSSTPLGLAGPKPRSSRVSMTPESEAWVEDVLGRARKTSSTLRPPPNYGRANPTIPKMRSVSDMGSAGLSRRIALRGLNEKKT